MGVVVYISNRAGTISSLEVNRIDTKQELIFSKRIKVKNFVQIHFSRRKINLPKYQVDVEFFDRGKHCFLNME